MPDDPEEVLDFWLGELGPEDWFAGGEELDARCRDRFAALWQAAHDGGLEHWVEGAAGSLGYIVLTDQLPRNIWRGDGRSFATDARALAAAKRAVAEGWDLAAPEPDRVFFYMPFEHSEDAGDQAEAVALIGGRLPETGTGYLLHARAHQEVIRRFGRFPTRNAVLGRESTPEEAEFLASGGYGAVVRALEG